MLPRRAGILATVEMSIKALNFICDIQGMEDFMGDMDFKVTGTAEGVTAIQMDIKVHGLSRDIMEKALKQAHEDKMHIMNLRRQIGRASCRERV